MVDYFNARVVAATSATFTNDVPPTPLPQAGTPAGLQTDADYVYWIDTSAKQFYRARKAGATAAETITPPSGMPSGSLWFKFLVDSQTNRLYFVSPAPTALRSWRPPMAREPATRSL